MGAVFLAREPALKRLVAVKVLSPFLAADPKARARFAREATAAAQLSHPNIVRVYAVGVTKNDGLPYFIMQYVEGTTLATWRGERDKVSERDARRIIGEVAAALASAQRRDLVHRDVKPSNVLLEQDSGRAYVADFGVSAALSSEQQRERTRLTATGAVVGTPIYMSPEQAAGEAVTPKSDVYSLGMLAYELVTGELPFSATSALGWVAAHMRDTPTPVKLKRPDLSPEVLRLIDRCLAKDPAERPDADEVARGMLPSFATESEWPPPGLAEIRSRSKGLQQLLNFAAIGGLMLVMMSALTPDILQVHQRWLERFVIAEPVEGDSVRTRASAVESGEVTFFAWQTGFMVGTGVFALGLLLSGTVGLQLANRLRYHRRAGWRWDTLADVAADPDGRSGRILTGAREFASLDGATRARILRTRRVRAVLTGGVFMWVIVAVALWLTTLAAGFGQEASPTTLAGFGTALFVAVPAIGLLTAAALFTHRERLLLGALAKPRRAAGGAPDVAEWYRSAAGATTPLPAEPARGARRFLRPALIAVAAILMMSVIVWTALALIASLVAARFVQRTGPRTAELVSALDRLAREQPIARARPTWLALVPASVSLPDSAAQALMRRLVAREREDARDPLPPYDQARLQLYRSDSLHRLAVRHAVSGAMPADTIRLLEDLGRHPRTETFRRLARADSFDVFRAGLDRPLERYGGAWQLPIPRLAALREAAHVNTLTAIAALARRDRAGAALRLGENAAFAEKLLQEPRLFENVIAWRMVQREVLDPLGALADADGRAASAARLREARESLEQLFHSPRGSAGLAADLAHIDALRRVLAHESTLPGMRADLLVFAWSGICANPREMLTGPSGARIAAIREVASLSGIRYAHEILRLGHRMWDQPIGSLLSGPEFRDRSWLDRTPLAVALRVTMCVADQ